LPSPHDRSDHRRLPSIQGTEPPAGRVPASLRLRVENKRLLLPPAIAVITAATEQQENDNNDE